MSFNGIVERALMKHPVNRTTRESAALLTWLGLHLPQATWNSSRALVAEIQWRRKMNRQRRAFIEQARLRQ